MKAWLRSMGADADGLLRHSLLLFVATHLGSITNVLFHVVMGRLLPRSQYLILSAMLGTALVVSVPLSALNASLAHFAARFALEGRPGDILRLVRAWSIKLLFVVLPLLALGIAFRWRIAEFYRLDSSVPVVITLCMLAAMVYMPVFTGALQGTQAFLGMALCQHGWGVIRLLTGSALILAFGRSAIWGLCGQTLGVLASVGIGVLGLSIVLRGVPRGHGDVRGTDIYCLKSMAILGAFGVLMNMDVVMVKHLFPEDRAGLFAWAATIGRMVIFLPQPIAWAMFPKVVSAGAHSEQHRKTLGRAILMSVILTLAAVAGCCAWPQLPLLILFRQASPTAELANLVRALACAMGPLGLLFLLLNFEIAQHRFGLTIPMALCAIAYVGGVWMFHQSLWRVAAILGIVSTLGCLVALAAVLKDSHGERGVPRE